jgi:hypothetical protein
MLRATAMIGGDRATVGGDPAGGISGDERGTAC